MNSVRLPAWFARASLACLALIVAAVQAPGLQAQPSPNQSADSDLPKLIATSQTSFEIPFSLNASLNNVVQVVLSVSGDKGQTWTEHSRRAPGANSFPFSSPTDQELWFAIQTVNRDGVLQPPNNALQPELRIAIDRQKPELHFEVRPDAAGRLVGVWTAMDSNIDPCSMTIQYQNDGTASEKWYTVPSQTCRRDVGKTWRDQLAWWPQSAARILTVRAIIKDLAGNVTTVERKVSMSAASNGLPPLPTGNHLRPAPVSPAQTTGNQLNTGNINAGTNYLRSRMPFALSGRGGSAPRTATNTNDSRPANGSSRANERANARTNNGPGLQQNAPPIPSSSNLPNGSDGYGLHNSATGRSAQATNRVAATASWQPMNRSTNSINLSHNESTPQPPATPDNRFAGPVANVSNAVNHGTAPTPPSSSTRWRSRTTGPSRNQISSSSTYQSVPEHRTTTVGNAENQANELANHTTSASVVGSPSQRPSQRPSQPGHGVSNASARPLSGNSGVPAKTAIARSHQVQDPLRPKAPFVPDSSQFRNDPSSANGQWISSTTGASQSPAPVAAPALATGPALESLRRSARPSNSKRFQLQYDIDAIGPEGVKEVQLWATRDGGNSWRRMTVDEDRRSPVNVQVDGEGIYGFRILIVSNQGLRAKQPTNGDPADIWVNVDTTLPLAQITAVPYGRDHDAGKLVIQWKASDTNLKLRPVNLSYRPGLSGPWTTIKDGLRNEGHFAWKPGANIPDKIYLRLEVRDQAGNVGVHQLDRQVDVSGLIPRGHIRGITPIRELPTGGGGDKDT